MSESKELSPFNEQDFFAIEAAVLETEKGRWFLNEFARRNRVADTQTLLNALNRLERNLTAQSVDVADEHPDVTALARAIEATSSDIEAVRNDMLADKAEIPADTPVFTHLSQTAHAIAADLISTAEALQSTVAGLRETAAAGEHADRIDSHVHTLFDGGWRQDVLAQRIAKAMGLLEHLEQNLKSMDPGPDVAPDALQTRFGQALSQDNLKYFDTDDDLFASQEPEASPPKPQIKVIASTPLSDETVNTPAANNADEYARKETGPASSANTVIADVSVDSEPLDEPCASADTSVIAHPPTEQSAPAASSEEPRKPNVIVVKAGQQAASPAPVLACDVQSPGPDEGGQTVEQPPSEAQRNDLDANEPSAPQATETTPQPEFVADTAEPQAITADDPSAHAAQPETDHMTSVENGASEPQAQASVSSASSEGDASNPDQDDNQRIVIIRRNSSAEAEIPFADYLGIESEHEAHPVSPDATTSAGS